MKRLARWAVSLLLIGIALYMLDLHTLLEALKRINAWYLALALLLCCAHFLLTGLRWFLLVKEDVPLPFFEHLRVYLYSNLFNAMTPANVGGDVYRSLALRHAASLSPVVLAILRERVLGVVGYLTFFLLAWALARAASPVPALFSWAAAASLGAVAGVCCLAFLLARVLRAPENPGWSGKLLDLLRQALVPLFRQRFALLLGLTLLATAFWVATVKVTSLGLGLDIGWTSLGMTAILVELARFIPVTVQGIGIREGGYAMLLALQGVSSEQGFAVGALAYLVLGAALLLTGCLGALLPAAPKSTAQ